jgi:hypothetical protein
MTWIASLPAGVLLVGWLAIALGIAAASRWALRSVLTPAEPDQVHPVAAALMTALGATFAVLMALTLASEAGYLRSAQETVSTEAGQASRLAWAATSPGVETTAVQTALADYLRATRTNEWRGADTVEREDPATVRALARLERTVRGEATRVTLATPTGNELLASLDGVTVARRDRLAASSRELPALYVATLLASGLALIVNAGALTCRLSWRHSILIVGPAAVVGLSLALLFALSGPWDGPLVVSGEPVDIVLQDLRVGYFRA